jgi:Uma2 family endonuclease
MKAVAAVQARIDSVRLTGDRVVLSGIRWDTYDALLNDRNNRHVFLTYDRGRLEFTTPFFRRERYAVILAELVKALAKAAKVRIMSAGSTTLRQEHLKQGLEPDRSFYIRHIEAVLGKLDLDLNVDPPPDLAIEIDIASSALDRLGIYAALNVPEVWRFDGEHIEMLVRRDETGYDRAAASPIFPAFSIAEVVDLLNEVASLDDAAMERHVRAWVRENAVPRISKPARRRNKK